MDATMTRPRCGTVSVVVLVAAVLVAALFSQKAQAIPTSGSIVFSGNGSGTQSAGTTTLTFNAMAIATGTVEYSGIPAGTMVNFAPLSWTGSGNGAVLTSPSYPAPEWTLNSGGTTYRFNPLSVTNAVMNTTLGTVNITGHAVVFITGAITRDPSFASFSIQGTLNNLTYTVLPSNTSACAPETCIPAPVPEGGSAIALLGASAIWLQTFRRKIRA